MTTPMYRDPVFLDSETHRNKRLLHRSDYTMTEGLHACFLGVTEFPHATGEFPIIFVDTGEKNEDGKPVMAPSALLGVSDNENLLVENGQWKARYVPAFIRRYPFFTARISDDGRMGVFIDAAWPGFNDQDGERIFDDEGQATDLLKNAVEFLQRFDEEVEQTRLFCARVVDLDLLEYMTARLTLADGSESTVDGFYVVNESRLAALSDEVMLELNKSGMLMMLHAHLISLGMMRVMTELKSKRVAAEAAAGVAAAPLSDAPQA
jgi:hypothetical protein